jgi:hypothetical protein
MKDEFFEWFRAQDPDRFLSKELAAKDAWDYQQANLQVAVVALEFYNQPKKYHGHESSKYGYVAGEIVNDNGDTAKEALEKIKAK